MQQDFLALIAHKFPSRVSLNAFSVKKDVCAQRLKDFGEMKKPGITSTNGRTLQNFIAEGHDSEPVPSVLLGVTKPTLPYVKLFA